MPIEEKSLIMLNFRSHSSTAFPPSSPSLPLLRCRFFAEIPQPIAAKMWCLGAKVVRAVRGNCCLCRFTLSQNAFSEAMLEVKRGTNVERKHKVAYLWIHSLKNCCTRLIGSLWNAVTTAWSLLHLNDCVLSNGVTSSSSLITSPFYIFH